MKLKIQWKKLGKQRGPLRALRAIASQAAPLRNAMRFFGASWEAVKPVLLAAIGGGIVTVAAGCSSLTPSSKVQTMGVYALGIPGIAVITQTTQAADYSGGDTNGVSQSNPVSTKTDVPVSASLLK